MAEDNIFMYGLVGGLLIFATLFIAFGTDWNSATYGFGQPYGIGDSYVEGCSVSNPSGYAYACQGGRYVLSQPTPVLIAAGAANNEPVGSFSDVGALVNLGRFDLLPEQVMEYPGGEIHSGLLFGSNKISFEVYNPVSIEFTILDTNNYGTLSVYVNNNLVAEMNDRGQYFVGINKAGPVKVEIVSSGSGWKIWAPALFDLSPITVKTARTYSEMTFVSSGDVAGGDIEMTFDSTATVVITLNNRLVWSGETQPSIVVPIPLDAIVDGENKLSLQLMEGATTGNVNISLLYIKDFRFELHFFLSSEDSQKLPGLLSFDIPLVMKSGTLHARIFSGNEPEKIHFFELLPVEVRTYTFYVSSNEIKEGENTLVIEGLDGSAFYVRNVRIMA